MSLLSLVSITHQRRMHISSTYKLICVGIKGAYFITLLSRSDREKQYITVFIIIHALHT